MARVFLLCDVPLLGLSFCEQRVWVLSLSRLGLTWRSKRVFWPACKQEKTSSYEESHWEGRSEGGRGVFRSGGAHAGRGLTQA